MNKKICMSVLIFITGVTISYGHGGRTDKSGGHRNSKTGGYHFHNSKGGGGGRRGWIGYSSRSFIVKYGNGRKNRKKVREPKRKVDYSGYVYYLKMKLNSK